MRHNLLPLFCVLCAFCGCRITAQGSAVMVDDQGNVVAPPGFWAANPIQGQSYPYNFDYVLPVWQEDFDYVQNTSETQTNGDRIETRFLTSALIPDHRVLIEFVRDGSETGISYSSSDEAVATVTSEGRLEHVADGEVTVSTTVGDYTHTETLDLQTEADTTSPWLVSGYVAGSLREAMESDLDAALATSTDINMFSSIDASTQTYVRNEDFYGYAATGGDEQWTAVPVWTSYAGTTNRQFRGGTAISSNVVVFAMHYPHQPGSTIRWLSSDDTIVERTVVDIRRVTNADGSGTDIGLAKLDSALPSTVNTLPIMPADWTDKYFHQGLPTSIPAIGTNKHLQGSVRAMVTTWDNGVIKNYRTWPYLGWSNPRVYPNREATYIRMVGGDSGSACVLIVDQTLVLAGTWYTSIGFPPLEKYTDRINAAIADMGLADEVQVIDLSGYTIYNAPPSIP